MLFAILILFVLPIVNTSEIRSTTFRPLFKFFFWILIGDFIFLGWVGQKPVRDTFIFVGQVATAYYFIFFTILVPIIGIVEKKLIRYPAVSSFKFTKMIKAYQDKLLYPSSHLHHKNENMVFYVGRVETFLVGFLFLTLIILEVVFFINIYID